MKKNIVYILVFCVIVGLVIAAIVGIKTFYPLRYTEQVVGYAKKHHIDPYLALAVINTESRFNKNATSSQEAKGLMQITDATAKEVNDNTNSAKEINDDTLYDVDVNVELGCNYLQSLILRSTSLSTLSNISAINPSKIIAGVGGIYVPSTLLSYFNEG